MDKRTKRYLQSAVDESEFPNLEAIHTYLEERHHAIEQSLASSDPPEHLRSLPPNKRLLAVVPYRVSEALLLAGVLAARENLAAREEVAVQEEASMNMLHNSLFSFGRLEHARHQLLNSGYDHCILFNQAVAAIAGWDLALVNTMFPPAKGLAAKGQRFLVAAANLFMSTLWDDDRLVAKSVEQAEVFLTRKNSKFDDASVRYLVAVATREVTVAQDWLSRVCSMYMRATSIHGHRGPILKVLGIYPHGLFNLGVHRFGTSGEPPFSLPDDPFLWRELADFQQQSGHAAGEPLLTFRPPIAVLNEIYE